MKKAAKPETVSVGNVMVRIYKRHRELQAENCSTIFEVADYSGGARRLRGFGDQQAKRSMKPKKSPGRLPVASYIAATMRNSEAASFGRAIEILRPTGVSLELELATAALPTLSQPA